MKYTRGEWYIWHTNNAGDIIQTTEHQIATVIQAGYFDTAGKRESSANAHLISAAPDMYEALKALCPCMRSIPGGEIPYEWAISEKAMDNARKAIAKAEGK